MQLPTIQDLEILLYFLFGDPKIYIVTTIAAPKQTVITQIKPAGEQKKEKKNEKKQTATQLKFTRTASQCCAPYVILLFSFLLISNVQPC